MLMVLTVPTQLSMPMPISTTCRLMLLRQRYCGLGVDEWMAHARHLKAVESQPLLARSDDYPFEDDPALWEDRAVPQDDDEAGAQMAMQAKLGAALQRCPGPRPWPAGGRDANRDDDFE